MKKFLFFIFLFNVFLLSGCTSLPHIPLSAQNSRSIKTIYVNPQIKKPKEMYEFVSGAQVGLMFGLAGGMISAVVNEESAASMKQFVEKNGIDIRQIVYQAWLNEINKKSKFKLNNKQGANAVLITNIILYGITIPNGFSTDYIPILTLNAKLIRHQQILWQDTEISDHNTTRYKMDQILHHPETLKRMWDEAAEKTISKLLRDMNK
jgi:hypothetical protein